MTAWLERPPRPSNGSRCSCFSMQHAMISFVEGQSIGKCLRWECWVESVDTSQLLWEIQNTSPNRSEKKVGKGLQETTHHNHYPEIFIYLTGISNVLFFCSRQWPPTLQGGADTEDASLPHGFHRRAGMRCWDRDVPCFFPKKILHITM